MEDWEAVHFLVATQDQELTNSLAKVGMLLNGR